MLIKKKTNVEKQTDESLTSCSHAPCRSSASFHSGRQKKRKVCSREEMEEEVQEEQRPWLLQSDGFWMTIRM